MAWSQEPGVELDQVGVRFRANDLEHLVLRVDQDQGAIVIGADSQFLCHRLSPAQFFSVPSKSMVRWVPSQNGLLFE
jgi:hypothetical protein